MFIENCENKYRKNSEKKQVGKICHHLFPRYLKNACAYRHRICHTWLEFKNTSCVQILTSYVQSSGHQVRTLTNMADAASGHSTNQNAQRWSDFRSSSPSAEMTSYLWQRVWSSLKTWGCLANSLEQRILTRALVGGGGQNLLPQLFFKYA